MAINRKIETAPDSGPEKSPEIEIKPESVEHLLAESEQAIDASAERALSEHDKIAEKLAVLEVAEPVRQEALSQIAQIDEEIEITRASYLQQICGAISEGYQDQVSEPFAAWLRVRPAERKLDRLGREAKMAGHGEFVGGDVRKKSEILRNLRPSVGNGPSFLQDFQEYYDFSINNDRYRDTVAAFAGDLFNTATGKIDRWDWDKVRDKTVTGFALILNQLSKDSDRGKQNGFRQAIDTYFQDAHDQSRNAEYGVSPVSLYERLEAFNGVTVEGLTDPERRIVLQEKALEFIGEDFEKTFIEHAGQFNGSTFRVFRDFLERANFSPDHVNRISAIALRKLWKHSHFEAVSCQRYFGVGAEVIVSELAIKERVGDVARLFSKLTDDQKNNIAAVYLKDKTIDEFIREHEDELFAKKDEMTLELLNATREGAVSSEDRSRLVQDLFDKYLRVNDQVRLLQLSKQPAECFSPRQARLMAAFRRIGQSPSATMRNLSIDIASQLPDEGEGQLTGAREEELDKLEEVFLRNNLPFVGQQFKVFQILYPDGRFQNSFREHSSPELLARKSSNERRLILFKDLMKINLGSLSGNLREYLEVIHEGANALEKYERGEKLNDEENRQLGNFLKKIEVLGENIRRQDPGKDESDIENDFGREVESLRKSFGAKRGETIVQKFNRTFLQRIGVPDVETALQRFEDIRQQTDTRNRQQVESGRFLANAGDLVKVVRSAYLDQLLERGLVSPEFIGADTAEATEKSKIGDATPWDTDVIEIESIRKDLNKIKGYGDIAVVIKDRGQFNRTRHGQSNRPTGAEQMELFKTGVIDIKHYGVRTGIPSTEIDALFLTGGGPVDKAVVDRIKFNIARKGFYIPICSDDGEVIFTPEMFEAWKTREPKLSFDGRRLDELAGQKDFVPRDILPLIRESFPGEWQSDAGVGEGYTLGQHTEMVLGQFEKYFGGKKLPLGMDDKFMGLLLCLHDIGKPQALELVGKEFQHDYTKPVVQSVFKRLGFSPERVRLARALVSGDPIGEYIKENGNNVADIANFIVQKSQVCNASPGELLDGFLMLYKVDAGSYTLDARGGKRSLDQFFEFRPEEGTMDFAPQYRPLIEKLREAVNQFNA